MAPKKAVDARRMRIERGVGMAMMMAVMPMLTPVGVVAELQVRPSVLVRMPLPCRRRLFPMVVPLAIFFACFMAYVSLQMLANVKPKPSRELPRPLGMFGVGNAIGFISSLVGAGGGFISVPFMVWSNVKIHNAVATSAALGFPIAAAGTVGYILAGVSEPSLPTGTAGFVYLPALLAVAGGSVLTAPLGARVAHALDTGRLKRIFALLLFVLAGYMLYRGIRAT